MSVINYLNTDRYILIIINQNRSAIWGTQDSLVKGYRPWPKINPAGNKVAGFEYTKDTALNDVYTFNTLEKAMELLQSYVTELNDKFGHGWITEGDYKGRCISISAGPLDKWKDFETWVPDSINGVKEKIIGPFPKVSYLLKDYIVKRENVGLATNGHITIFADKPIDDKRSDIRLYEWILIPVRGTI